MKVSDCCGAEAYSNGDSSTEDYGICPECKEHCEYIDYCDDCEEEKDKCICPIELQEDKRSVARNDNSSNADDNQK